MDSLEDRFLEAIDAATRVDSVEAAIELGKQVKQLAHELHVGDFTNAQRYDLTKLRNEAVTKAQHALHRTKIARNVAEADAERRQREAERAELLADLERGVEQPTNALAEAMLRRERGYDRER
ncbi:hypothetical protein [Nocardia sp. BMG51109]|uniref:hypothetical protein n=1 Tax=Nocardia sp. BMG51109 TaxID=1056816 RepID=UPI000463324C|nr:hypothetical protein [Nocardia sp. BMG51109]